MLVEINVTQQKIITGVLGLDHTYFQTNKQGFHRLIQNPVDHLKWSF